MPDKNQNFIGELDKFAVKKAPKPAKKAKPAAVESASAKTLKEKKDDSHLFSLVVVVIIILGIIGIVFGYTRDKISQISKGGSEATQGLQDQFKNLQDELAALKAKADNLAIDNQNNKEAVIDLFDKERTLPTSVDAAGWSKFSGASVGFTLSYPAAWQAIKPAAAEVPAGQKEASKIELIYLQPVNDAGFANAVTVKADYTDFAKLPIKDKLAIFKELNTLDIADFKDGKMVYFINFDKNNKAVPTILILTKESIYSATFNITDKTLTNYIGYRKDFENIISTFLLAKPAAAATTTK